MGGGAAPHPGAHHLAPARCNILLQAHLSWCDLFLPRPSREYRLPLTYFSNSLTCIARGSAPAREPGSRVVKAQRS